MKIRSKFYLFLKLKQKKIYFLAVLDLDKKRILNKKFSKIKKTFLKVLEKNKKENSFQKWLEKKEEKIKQIKKKINLSILLEKLVKLIRQLHFI